MSESDTGFIVALLTVIILLFLCIASMYSVMQGYTVSNKKLIECGYAEYNKATGKFHFIEPKKKVKDVGR